MPLTNQKFLSEVVNKTVACYAFSIQPNYPQIWKFKHQEKENEDLGKEEHFISIYIW